MSDPWNIGTLHKSWIWIFYGLSNYVGVVLCGILIRSVYKNPSREASDVFVAGLASGCLSLSITCGTQCFANLHGNRFNGGDIACQIEAIAHISSILTEFFCVSCVSLSFYLKQVRSHKIEQKMALWVVVGIWIGCVSITGLLSLFSDIYLMSAGTYCFFSFDSFAILGWLVPGLIFALSTMFVCHILILRHYKNLIQQLKDNSVNITVISANKITELWHQQFKWRSTMLIVILLVGWGFAAVTAIYELSVGRASEFLVTAVGVGGVSFSWWMPLVYALTSDHCKMYMIYYFGWIFILCWGREWWIVASGQNRKKKFIIRIVGRASETSSGKSQDEKAEIHGSKLQSLEREDPIYLNVD